MSSINLFSLFFNSKLALGTNLKPEHAIKSLKHN